MLTDNQLGQGAGKEECEWLGLLTSGSRGAPSLRATPSVFSLDRGPWSKASLTVCPVIGAFMRRWKEGLRPYERSVVTPLFPRIVHTFNSADVHDQRAIMAADWLTRTYTPAWLDLAGLGDQACHLRDLAPISRGGAAALAPELAKLSQDLNALAATVSEVDWTRSSDEIWATAWAASYEAACFTTHNLAWICTASISRAAAGLAADDITPPFVNALQISAAELVLRMARLGEKRAEEASVRRPSSDVARWAPSAASVLSTNRNLG